ncbi:MAG: SAM-dependent DNA methyltransferase, partial [Spirochaetia bacterium]|nr:SAM-dependent DNA methyltransferase [Spirochaetia bacterium]
RKKDINDSGVKIGARELPAVTQLFTEPYMVSFLLDNSLGAWWAAKKLSSHDLATAEDEQELRDKAYVDHLPLEYLRFVKNEETESWKPAGGTFDAWPKHLSEFKMLDPCCGSGHFLVATLQMLVPMRMELEGLSEDEAIQKVLEENIHGLELDQRCVELAAFTLAFAAWTYPGSSGYRQLPALHIACSGQAIHISDDELRKLANGNHELYYALEDLRNKFEQAPILGSLIDPKSSIHQNELFSLAWEEVGPLLDSVLRKGQDDDLDEAGIVAQGLAKAAILLAGTYHLVATNVPYLARGKQDQVLKDYCDRYHNEAKNDLATVFLDRCLQFCPEGGTTTVVLPQNWLFLTSYTSFRKTLLKKETFNLIGRLGAKSFQTPMWDFNVQLFVASRETLIDDTHLFGGIDVSAPNTAEEKAKGLVEGEIKRVGQEEQLKNPDARIALEKASHELLLNDGANCMAGILNGDSPHFLKYYWELMYYSDLWSFQQTTHPNSQFFGGLTNIVYYDESEGHLREEEWIRRERLHDSDQRGQSALGRYGVAISQMRILPVTIFIGKRFDSNVAVLVSEDKFSLPAVWAYLQSSEYNEAVRRIDQKLNVTNATLVKVPFDLERWTKVAEEKYPNGLPLPFSDDPTQWIFHGHPCKSIVWDEDAKWTGFGPIRFDSTVLHVAVARLLGYRWPAEFDPKMELAKEQRALVSECEALLPFADNDGIVCIPSVGGEFSASERLLKMLKASYGDAWTDDTLSALLRNTDTSGKTLENWLRDKFFIQHCKLFGDRPFIWHVWDGLPDGFSALVNYHKLDYKKLETLIYSYLGDWIQRQKTDVAINVEGAREKLSAAQALSQRLELILEGENPYDIFVRWKSLEEQPIGWNPDLNDGVRLNIRPFMSVPDIGKKDAGVLRDKPNIKWTKDRGQDVETA